MTIRNRDRNPPYCFIWNYKNRRFILPCLWTTCPRAIYFISDFFLKATGLAVEKSELKSIVPEYMQMNYMFKSSTGRLSSADCLTVGGAQFFLLPHTEKQAAVLLDFVKKECIPDLTVIDKAPKLQLDEFEFPIGGDTIRVAVETKAKGTQSFYFVAWDVATILNPAINLIGFTDMLKTLSVEEAVTPVWVAGYPSPFAVLTDVGVKSLVNMYHESANASAMEAWLSDFQSGNLKPINTGNDTLPVNKVTAYTEDGLIIKEVKAIPYMGMVIQLVKHNEAKWYSVDDIATALTITSHHPEPDEAKETFKEILATYSADIISVKFGEPPVVDGDGEVIKDDTAGEWLKFISGNILHLALIACIDYDSGLWIGYNDVRTFERRLKAGEKPNTKLRGESTVDIVSSSDVMSLLPISGESDLPAVYEDAGIKSNLVTVTEDSEETPPASAAADKREEDSAHEVVQEVSPSPSSAPTVKKTAQRKSIIPSPKWETAYRDENRCFISSDGCEVASVIKDGSLWVSLPQIRELIGRHRHLNAKARAADLMNVSHIFATVPSNGVRVRSVCINVEAILKYGRDHCVRNVQAKSNLIEFASWLNITVKQLASDNILSFEYVTGTVLPALEEQYRYILDLPIHESLPAVTKRVNKASSDKVIPLPALAADVKEESAPVIETEPASVDNASKPVFELDEAADAFIANPVEFLKDLLGRIKSEQESHLIVVLRAVLEIAERKETEEELQRLQQLKLKLNRYDEEYIPRIDALLDTICNGFDKVHSSLKKLVEEVKEILKRMTSDDD